MPFGFVNSSSSYNRLIWKILHGSKNLESYVDVLALTPAQIGQMEVLRDFFQRVRKANLTLAPRKCYIVFMEVDFLGHTIEGNSTMPIPETKRQS